MIEISQNLLENFFSNSNKINYKNGFTIENNKYNDIKNELINWVNFFIEKKTGEILFPFISNDDYFWYACSNDKTSIKRIHDELNSFIGAYSTITNINDDANYYEKELLSFFGNNNVIKIIPVRKFEKEILNSISLYRNILTKKPLRSEKIVRGFSTIRSDFDKSLSVSNKYDAEKYMDEMIKTGRLDLINKTFLQIQMNAALGEWNKILQHSYLPLIIKNKMPKKILSNIIEAVYYKYFSLYESNKDYDSILKEFKEVFLLEYGSLIKTRRDIKHPSVIKIFFIKELINDEINFQYCQELIDIYPLTDQSGISFLKELLKFIKTKKEVSEVKQVNNTNNYHEKYQKALDEIDNVNYDSALNILLDLPPDIDVIKSIFNLIKDIDSNESYNSAWNYMKYIDAPTIKELPPRAIKQYKDLKELIESNNNILPDNIHLIINYFLETKDEFKTRELIENTYTNWQINFYLKDKANMLELINLLNELNQDVNYVLLYKNYLLPKIIDTFFIEFDNNDKLRNLSNSILSGYIFFENFTNSDLTIFQELSNYSILSGINNQQFKDIIDTLKDIFSKNSAIQNINWFIDIIELITLYSPSDEVKTEIASFFIGSLCPYIKQNKHRIDLWSTIEQLGRDFGIYDSLIKDILPEVAEDENITSDLLSGKLVSIYTLTDQVAYRAKKKIESLYPGVIVKTNNDKSATPVLVNLARTSNIFIFCWKSSKHQAFFSIKDNLRDKNAFIQPEGKGSDSIIRKLNEYVESNYR